jgi:hypothetical protein
MSHLNQNSAGTQSGCEDAFNRTRMVYGAGLAGSVFLALLLLAWGLPASPQRVLEEPEESIIHYSESQDLADPVSRLQKKITDGKTKLEYEGSHGYLASLLNHLGIPAASQSLVFSKTSSQNDHISPKTPRALYFNQEVYIAWVPGGEVIDIAAVDPNKGPVFFTLSQSREERPRFVRRDDCMRCHLGSKTLDVPGLFVRSNFTAPDGAPLSQITEFVSGHNSPLKDRWGGWYVTGTHANDVHLGNITVADRRNLDKVDLTIGGNITSLQDRFDTTRYLSPGSDIVALLVLEHQIRMQNYLTRANYETKYALADRRRFKDTSSPQYAWTQQRISAAGEALLTYMLFRDEAPLKGEVKGTSTFASDFTKVGPRDRKGRSLRDFDLKTRLFRYPCSFLIYSQAFNALPEMMKDYLYRRLREVLSGKDRSRMYATLSAGDRKAVFAILLDTKPEFAAWIKTHIPRAALTINKTGGSE